MESLIYANRSIDKLTGKGFEIMSKTLPSDQYEQE